MTSDAVHESLGVRWDGGAGADASSDAVRLPRNYGDPAAEYDAACSDVAVVDRRDRRFLRVHGRDPVRMVQGLITNDIANAAADRAVYAAVLTAKGKMVADLRVLRRGAELLLETDRRAIDPLTAHLRKFVPPLFARFESADDAWSELSVLGPRARALLDDVLGIDLPQTTSEGTAVDATLDGAPIVVITSSHVDVEGFDLLVPASAVDSAWARLVEAGARPVGHATFDVLRIEAGRPRWGAELGDSTIPLEAGLRERAISESKGCYTGQEVIVRILHRGHVNWLLRGVLLGDAAAPAYDAPLVNAAGRQVGRITSAAWSPKHGQSIGLAYVRREVEPPATLQLGDTTGPAVSVVTLPFAGTRA
ncbi:glycine cleavage T C-terminal barrel domain-containing protein [soil metagenome]